MKKYNSGIYKNIPFDEYLKIPYFSKSMVSHINISPKRLKHCINNPEEKPHKFKDFGSLVDCLLLSPDEFEVRFFVLPEHYVSTKKEKKPWNLNSKTCRKMLNDAIAKGKIAIKSSEIEKARRVIEEIKKHPTAKKQIGFDSQVTVIWKDPQTGIMCKARPDLMPEKPNDANGIIDLKLTEDVSPSAFSRTCTRFLYHVQGAMYVMGSYCAVTGKYPEDWNIPFSFIAAESEQPHDVVCYFLGIESLDAGKVIFQSAIEKYANCVKANKWPGVSDFLEQIDIQQWAIHRILYEGADNV